MFRQQPRIPESCPPGSLARYTVTPGDTFYNLSQMFRIRLETLAANNPHITEPRVIYPGDVLCVPGLVPFPCCVLLRSRGKVPFGTGGTAFLNFGPRGGQSVTVTATLPLPSTFGNYDAYRGELFIPGMGNFSAKLFGTPEDPPTWTARIDLPTAASVAPNTRVTVRPLNTRSNSVGNAVLEGRIAGGDCCG